MPGNTLNEPDQTALLLQAYVDGELDPANALAIERRIASDAQLAGEYDRILVLRQVLQERLPREPAPAGLAMRVHRSVGTESARRVFDWRTLAASIAVAAVLSSGATWLALHAGSGQGATEAVVAGHIRSLMAPQPTDVASTDRHVVKPWFNGRVPHAPRVVDLAKDGFPLVGGRIDVVGRAAVPTLVYRHRQHLISLTAVPAATAVRVPRTMQGYHVVAWTSDGIGYWAVSDLGTGDLAKFVQVFRDAPADR